MCFHETFRETYVKGQLSFRRRIFCLLLIWYDTIIKNGFKEYITFFESVNEWNIRNLYI